MQPSSLVFVAIVAVWALYVVRSLVGRRVLLAESRTGDRFSSGLRVLSRRSRAASPRRSGESVLSSPRVVVDSDGELLYIPGTQRAARAAVAAPPAPRASAPATSALSTPRASVAAASSAPSAPAASSSVRPPSAVPAPAAPVAASSSPAASPAPAKLGTLDIAVMSSKIAARRRARIMAVLLLATISSWGIALSVAPAPLWLGLPASLLLVLHALASRAAGLRSREHLAYLARELASDEVRRPAVRPVAAPSAPVKPAPIAPAVPERVARRQAAVGAETWEPVPVPPPTYTLKPAVPRPEPAPLDLPAAAVSRGALPRTAADIERILSLDPSAADERKVVNG